MDLIRLVPSEPRGWQLWPTLEARVRSSLAGLSPRTPPDAVIGHLRKLWATAPATLGAWVGVVDGEVKAHLVGWVMRDDWGEWTVLIYQLEADADTVVWQMREPMLRALDAWRQEVNAYLPPEHKITRLKLFTTKNPKTWEHYLGKFVDVEPTTHILTLDMSTLALPDVPRETGAVDVATNGHLPGHPATARSLGGPLA